MTLFWLLITLTALVSALWMVWPFLRKTQLDTGSSQATLSIYRDQAEEVRRDLDAGLISPDELDAAQREIEARALKAADEGDHNRSVSPRSLPVAAIIVGATVVIALATYAMTGTPKQGDLPLSARADEIMQDKAQAGDLASALQLLQNRLTDDPENLQDWIMLAQGYLSFGDAARAAQAYGNAAYLSGGDIAILSAQAEAIIMASNDIVTPKARVLLETVLATSNDPRAQYYIAKAEAQAKNYTKAIQGWAALAASSAADDAWMPMVRRDIVEMARLLNTDVRQYLPMATAQEIARAGGDLPAGQDLATEAVQARVTALTAALDADPKQYQGWIELAQLHSRLGADQDAAAAIKAGKAHFATAPFVLVKLDEAAQSLGLHGKNTVSGLTGDDVDTITSMEQQDQEDLISDMVSGLADKLRDNPNNPDGWVMLIRSYATLGKPQEAQRALETALAAFRDNPEVLAILRQQAAPALNATSD